jgi:acetoin utilization protein AcuB
MLDDLVDALPVADASGRVVGVVTWSDLVAHLAGRQLTPPARP